MFKLNKISYRDNINLEKLIEMIQIIWNECYKQIIPNEQLDYILNFCKINIIKDEIKEDGFEYYFIEKDNEIIGFIEGHQTQEVFDLSAIYLLKQYRNKKYGKNIFNEILKIVKNKKLNKIRVYVNQKLENSICFFEKIGFENIKPMAIYIGSDYFLYTYLMIYNI